jgi:hypothetical protein
VKIKIYEDSIVEAISALAAKADEEGVSEDDRYIELPHTKWRLFICELVEKRLISMPIVPFAVTVFGVTVFEEKP